MRAAEIKKMMNESEQKLNALKKQVSNHKKEIQKLDADYNTILSKSSRSGCGTVFAVIFMLVGLIGMPMFLINYLDGRQNEGFLLFLENIAFFTFIPGGIVGFYIGTFLGTIFDSILSAPYKKKANSYYDTKMELNNKIDNLEVQVSEEQDVYKTLRSEYDYAQIYDFEANDAEEMARKYIILKTDCCGSKYAKDEIRILQDLFGKLSAAEKNTACAYMYEWLDTIFWEDKHNVSSFMFRLLLQASDEGDENAQSNLKQIFDSIRVDIEKETLQSYYPRCAFDRAMEKLSVLAQNGYTHARVLLEKANEKYKEISVPKVSAAAVQERLDEEKKKNARTSTVTIVPLPDVKELM